MNANLTNDHFTAIVKAAGLTGDEFEYRLVSGQNSVMVTILDKGQYYMDFVAYTAPARDEAWDEQLDYYIEECVLPEMPENLHQYFDTEAWKRDVRPDGAGIWLAPYDHEERMVTVDGTDFYVYRVN